MLHVCLSKPPLNLQLSSSSSPSVCCSPPPPLLFLCERSLGTEPSGVCFLNEYLMRLMRLAGGGASQWSTEREKGGREGGKERRQKHRTQETGKQPGRGRDLADWWPCITHTGAGLHTGLGVVSSKWGTSSSTSHCRGSTTSKPTERRGGAGAATGQAPGEESGTNRRSRKRSPRKHVSSTHTLT